MIHTRNLLSLAALVATAALCTPSPTQAAPLATLAALSGGNNGGGGGNNGLRCDAGGPYVVECASGPLTVSLDASGSTGATSYLWSTNYPGAAFADATAAQTTLIFTANGDCCTEQFLVTLTVGDGTRTRS